MKNKIAIGELKKGQTFKTELGTYVCTRPYWPEARNPAYRAAGINVVETSVPNVSVGQGVTFNHRTRVELLSA